MNIPCEILTLSCMKQFIEKKFSFFRLKIWRKSADILTLCGVGYFVLISL